MVRKVNSRDIRIKGYPYGSEGRFQILGRRHRLWSACIGHMRAFRNLSRPDMTFSMQRWPVGRVSVSVPSRAALPACGASGDGVCSLRCTQPKEPTEDIVLSDTSVQEPKFCRKLTVRACPRVNGTPVAYFVIAIGRERRES